MILNKKHRLKKRMGIEVYTVEEFQENWDEMIARVEGGEHIGIINEDGCAAVMMPAEDEMLKLYSDHNEAS